MADFGRGILANHNVTVVGRGEDTLVLVPGFGTGQAAWRHVVEALRDRYRIVLLDLVGLGPDDRRHYDHMRYARLEAYTEDLLDVLRRLEIGRCRYVGHSVAGMVGALASIREPELFGRIVLLGSSACYLDKGAYRGGFSREALQGLIDSATLNYLEWCEGFGRTVVSAPAGDPTVREFVGNLQAMRPDAALSILMAIFNLDLRDRLAEVSVPTIVLQTQNDPAVSREAAEYLRDHLAGSRLEVLETAGHLPHLSAPDQVIEALRRHL